MAVVFNLWPPALETDTPPLRLRIVTSQQGGTNWKCYLKQGLFIAALWSPAGKGLTTWLSFVMLNSVFVTFLCAILGQVWYLIVSIPDLCPFIT